MMVKTFEFTNIGMPMIQAMCVLRIISVKLSCSENRQRVYGIRLVSPRVL